MLCPLHCWDDLLEHHADAFRRLKHSHMQAINQRAYFFSGKSNDTSMQSSMSHFTIIPRARPTSQHTCIWQVATSFQRLLQTCNFKLRKSRRMLQAASQIVLIMIFVSERRTCNAHINDAMRQNIIRYSENTSRLEKLTTRPRHCPLCTSARSLAVRRENLQLPAL